MPLMRLGKKVKGERERNELLVSPFAFSLSPTVIALVQNSTWDKADSLNTLPTQVR